MATTKLTCSDLVDVAHGSTFLGGGGGGTLSSALKMIARGCPEGATVDLVPVDDAAAAAELTAACCYVGSQTQGKAVADPRALGYALDRYGALVFQRSGDLIRRLAPVDLGVQGSVIPCLLIAQQRGLQVVDADGAGRAVPGLMMTTWAIDGPPANPAVAANAAASATVVIEADTALNCHMIVNGLCRANNFGVAAVAMWGVAGEALRKAVPIGGTITLARDVGRTLRTSKSPVTDVVALLGAQGIWSKVLATGKISDVTELQQDYLVVTVLDAAGGKTTVKTAGESMVVYGPDGALIGMAPDALCWATPSGGTFSNTEVATHEGDDIVLVGVAARSPMRKPAIVRLFGYFLDKVGYVGDYVPLESLSKDQPAS